MLKGLIFFEAFEQHSYPKKPEGELSIKINK